MSKKEKQQEAAPQETLENEQADAPTQETSQPQAEQDAPDYYEQFVRLSADFANYRKRTERERAALIAYGKKDFALKMLPMYEVLLRQQKLMQNAKGKDAQKELKSLQDGMRMILSELEKAFHSEGITKMDVLKKPYDPQTQEVVAMVPAKDSDDGLVIDEAQMGFMMDGQVLRPARVIVGQKKEEEN